LSTAVTFLSAFWPETSSSATPWSSLSAAVTFVSVAFWTSQSATPSPLAVAVTSRTVRVSLSASQRPAARLSRRVTSVTRTSLPPASRLPTATPFVQLTAVRFRTVTFSGSGSALSAGATSPPNTATPAPLAFPPASTWPFPSRTTSLASTRMQLSSSGASMSLTSS